MRRALTTLSIPILLLSAWDCVPKTRATLQLWSRLRERHRQAPDVGWDRFYAELIPYLPARGHVGLVMVLAPGTPQSERQYYFLQYALAPRLVMPGSDEEFVIAYGPPAARVALLDSTKFALVKPFENEFALYRRVRP
jgi:hypothetical protein